MARARARRLPSTSARETYVDPWRNLLPRRLRCGLQPALPYQAVGAGHYWNGRTTRAQAGITPPMNLRSTAPRFAETQVARSAKPSDVLTLKSDRSCRALLLVVLAASALFRFWGLQFGFPHPFARTDEEVLVDAALSVLGDGNPRFFDWPSLFINLTA